MPYKDQEAMFLGRAKSCKKNGDRFWNEAKQAEANEKSSEEVEGLKKQAWHYYNQKNENLQKAKENKGKTFKKGDKNE